MFSDSRLRDIHRKAYENFCERSELRDYLLSHLTRGAYLFHGPFGWWDRHWLAPVRYEGACVDIVTWSADIEPVPAPPAFRTGGSQEYHPDTCFRRASGVADVMGVEAIHRALRYDSPVRVFRSPWRLILASNDDPLVTINGSPGVVVLTDDLNYWARMGRFAELHVEDREHAVELRSLIRASGATPPPICFPESGMEMEAA
jgi:hypothetical protein